MVTENVIVIAAPLEKTFQVASDLSLWPKILPHYRSIVYLKKSNNKNIVKMAAKRKWIPVKWTSEQDIDYLKKEVRFHHLKAFTKGMTVVWTFAPVAGGTEVRILHTLRSSIPFIGNFISDKIIGKYFISYIATQTLTHMKRYVELTNE